MQPRQAVPSPPPGVNSAPRIDGEDGEMTIEAGQELLHDRLVEKIGEGGMGS